MNEQLHRTYNKGCARTHEAAASALSLNFMKTPTRTRVRNINSQKKKSSQHNNTLMQPIVVVRHDFSSFDWNKPGLKLNSSFLANANRLTYTDENQHEALKQAGPHHLNVLKSTAIMTTNETPKRTEKARFSRGFRNTQNSARVCQTTHD